MQRITGPNSAFLTGGQPGNALHASSPLPFPPFLLRFPRVLPDRNAYRFTEFGYALGPELRTACDETEVARLGLSLPPWT
jgi:hypothetical protein